MNKLYSLIAACALACAMALGFSPPAAAATIAAYTNYLPNIKFDGAASATAYANATTTPTLITNIVALPYTNSDWTKQFIRVCYSADATKSTSTTGSISVYYNGVNIGATYDRYLASAAGRNTISACLIFQRPSNVAATIALYGTSQDTASFAITNVAAEAWRVILGGG